MLNWFSTRRKDVEIPANCEEIILISVSDLCPYIRKITDESIIISEYNNHKFSSQYFYIFTCHANANSFLGITDEEQVILKDVLENNKKLSFSSPFKNLMIIYFSNEEFSILPPSISKFNIPESRIFNYIFGLNDQCFIKRSLEVSDKINEINDYNKLKEEVSKLYKLVNELEIKRKIDSEKIATLEKNY